MDTSNESFDVSNIVNGPGLPQTSEMWDIDFSSANTVKMEFKSYQEAINCMERFKSSLSLDLVNKHVNKMDTKKQHVFWNNMTSIPYIVVQRQKWEYFRLRDEGPSICGSDMQNNYVVTILELLNFPTHKKNRKKPRVRSSKVIRSTLAAGNKIKDQHTTFCVQFLQKMEKPTTKIERNSLEVNGTREYNSVEQNIRWVDSMDECKTEIKNFEFVTGAKFVQYAKNGYDISKSLVRWDKSHDTTIIPYVIKHSLWLECEHGKNRHKTNSAKHKTSISDGQPDTPKALKTRKVRSTKKMDCNAKMFVQEVWKFPQFQTGKSTSEYCLKKYSRAIRNLIDTENENLVKEFACRICFPKDEDHSGHVMGQSSEFLPPTVATPTENMDEFILELYPAEEEIRTTETDEFVCPLTIEANDEDTREDEVRAIQESHQRFLAVANTLMEISYHVTSPEVLNEGISDVEAIMSKFSQALTVDGVLDNHQEPEPKTLERNQGILQTETFTETQQTIPRKRIKIALI